MSWRLLLGLSLFCILCTAAAGPEPNRPRPEFDIDHDGNRVVCHDAEGRVRWSTPLQGYLGRVRPPHLLHDAERVYVTHQDGVTALHRQTGKPLWHSVGPNDRLCLSGDLLLAADCSSDQEAIAARGRWCLARAVKDGKEVFKVLLPAKDFDPRPIREVAELFLVQTGEAPGGEGDALLFNREGAIHCRFDRQVVAGRRQGLDRLFLTSRDVVRLSADGKVVWSASFDRRQWIAGGDLLSLPDGQVLALLYCQIADSGVQVVRLDPATGKRVWAASCKGLGVTHSEYHHEATVSVEGDRVKVTSKGSSGTFVETLDLGSGKQVKRETGKR